ncbi:MAG: HK97 family phage prohead protease [Bacteroidales bacterium]
MAKTFILSDGTSVNSHGFILDLTGLDLERFRKNPVMLYNHDRDKPIGKWLDLRIEDNCLLADADIDTDDVVGREIARKVDKGYLKGCSLGLYIKRMTDDCRAVEAELVEASIVTIPSDGNAVCLYDENNKPTTFDAVRLSFNNKNKKMEKTEFMTELSAALGLEQGATAGAVRLAVEAKNAHIAQLEAIIAKHDEEKISALVNRAVEEKKIGADEKEAYTALAAKDYASVEKILNCKQGVLPIKTQLSRSVDNNKYAGKTWDEIDRAGRLAELKADAPEIYNSLFKEKFGCK